MITHSDLSEAGPNAASTVAIGTKIADQLDQFDTITAYLTVRGATGGISRVTLQVSHGADKWFDWYRSADIPALAAAKTVKVSNVNLMSNAPLASVLIGTGTPTAATPLLAKDTIAPGSWGRKMRAVFETDAGVTTGAMQDITLVGMRPSGG